MKEPLFDFPEKDEPNPLPPPPAPPPVIPKEGEPERRCPGDYGDYIHHLCCETFNGSGETWEFRFYYEMLGCTNGTKLNSHTLKRL